VKTIIIKRKHEIKTILVKYRIQKRKGYCFMYCLKCGKKILESDKFCPYCGTSQRKKVIIDTNSSAESLIKRGFLYAEDGDFESAKDYFDRALDQAPENAEAYLGKLLIQKKKHSKEELYDYYKELFAESDEEMAEVPFSKEEEKHIVLMCDKYCVPGYLEKSFIEN
jgi:tetratricopeptide (TPR) repeat protein